MKKFVLFMVILLASSLTLLATEPLLLIHGLGESEHTLDKVAQALTYDGLGSFNTIRVPFSSNNTIENMAKIVTSYLSTNDTTSQAVVITHSMGGLVARQYMENEMNNSEVKALITIASPNTGANIANKMTWVAFLTYEGVCLVGPIIADVFHPGALLNIVTSPIVSTAQSITNILNKYTNASINVSGDSNDLSNIFKNIINLISNTPIFWPCVNEMAPKSTFLNNLNTKTLPAVGKQGNPIWYSSIYGTEKSFFDLVDANSNSTTTTTFISDVCKTYAVAGAGYLLAAGFWNPSLASVGFCYLGGALGLTEGAQQFAWNLVVGSDSSDGVVPVSSQELQSQWVPANDQHYIPPIAANNSDHFTELNPTTEVNSALKTILRKVNQ